MCLFYLVLRGLDTVEDDMTLDAAVKRDLLKTFHEKLYQPGMHNGCLLAWRLCLYLCLCAWQLLTLATALYQAGSLRAAALMRKIAAF